MMTVLRRRRLLQAGWAGLLAGLAAPFGATPARAEAVLAAVFRQPGSARVVGRAVLAAHPHLADPGLLVEALTRRHPHLDELLRRDDRAALAQALGRAVRDDFAHGRTLLVEGWLLSKSEAELCALACLA